MKLAEATGMVTGARVVGDPETAFSAIADDSRNAAPGCLFAAVRGTAVDGHRFVGDAARRGASLFLVEDAAVLPAGASALVVPDSRVALARIAHRFLGDPTASMALVGITGTNGKTTTAYLVAQIMGAAGTKAGMIGTVVYRTGDGETPAGNTTPGALELAGLFARMRASDCGGAVFEVSSHALDQRRAEGCRLDVACFTNLTRDHLDYHRDEATYLAAKRRIFDDVLAASDKPRRTAVVNVDDPAGARLAADTAKLPGIGVVTVSAAGAAGATVRVVRSEVTLEGTVAVLATPAGEIALCSPLVGAFNLDNLAAACGCALGLGIALDAIARGAAELKGVPGRLERVAARDITVLVDYAHTGDALERSVATVRRLAPRRLITVFGCGGDRDRGKRPIMGKAAASASDLTIVTSDNPRTEDPETIIGEIVPGVVRGGARHISAKEARGPFAGRGYVVEPDRRSAIRLAIETARPGDAVLIAGKGHEDYQILGRRKIHFDDREEARAAIRRREESR